MVIYCLIALPAFLPIRIEKRFLYEWLSHHGRFARSTRNQAPPLRGNSMTEQNRGKGITQTPLQKKGGGVGEDVNRPVE